MITKQVLNKLCMDVLIVLLGHNNEISAEIIKQIYSFFQHKSLNICFQKGFV